ncbi:MAG: MarR family transcriptional regulator [DPANN group archaeon]|nr:MarR family transcriptional regulator [DPANN group archaeon]
MQDKTTGYFILTISALVGFIIYLFNKALKDIVAVSCDHGDACPMWGSINFQTNISLAIMTTLIIIGLYLIFAENIKEHILKKTKVNTKINKTDLLKKARNPEEKLILECILEKGNTIFQSDLVDKTKLSKVKITRILNRLETRNIIERKRRGMTNIVILKRQ